MLDGFHCIAALHGVMVKFLSLFAVLGGSLILLFITFISELFFWKFQNQRTSSSFSLKKFRIKNNIQFCVCVCVFFKFQRNGGDSGSKFLWLIPLVFLEPWLWINTRPLIFCESLFKGLGFLRDMYSTDMCWSWPMLLNFWSICLWVMGKPLPDSLSHKMFWILTF